MTNSEISNLIESILDRAGHVLPAKDKKEEYRIFVPYMELLRTGQSKHHVAEFVLIESSAEDARNHAIRQISDSCMSARSRKDLTSFKIAYSNIDVKKITKY